jgi:uncharacterized protein
MSHQGHEGGLATKNTKITKVLESVNLGVLRVLRGSTVFVFLTAAPTAFAQGLPELTQPVNDFAGVIDAQSASAMSALIRSLQDATGDVVVVAAVKTFAPYADVREYANRLFENHGRGIGDTGKDNGALVLIAVDDRQCYIESGYDLEQFITDGFLGDTCRQHMNPEFRQGRYGAGLLAGVSRVIGRIADGRNVSLQGIPRPRRRDVLPDTDAGPPLIVAIFIALLVLNTIASRLRGGRRRRGRWGGFDGWSSGVGPFGGGFGGGFGRGGGFGGFGGGFGGFGGGRSGGGGGGAGW